MQRQHDADKICKIFVFFSPHSIPLLGKCPCHLFDSVASFNSSEVTALSPHLAKRFPARSVFSSMCGTNHLETGLPGPGWRKIRNCTSKMPNKLKQANGCQFWITWMSG